MKPFEDYMSQLFKPLSIESERIVTFSCNHVIASDKLISVACSKGPSNIPLNYSFANRNSPELIRETGRILVDLCQIVPKGVVVFFPSYDYEEFLLEQWNKFGILKSIEKFKRIFREPKKSSIVGNILNSYTRFIKSSSESGGIIFSVIGGKMSEGINFSDDLGRAVVVIGLPYANRNSIELKEKISYLNKMGDNLGNVTAIDLSTRFILTNH